MPPVPRENASLPNDLHDWTDAKWKRIFRRRLLRWFEEHARELPWRGASDAYRVWVSEIMLQQTQAATVIPFYERFIARFPHLAALAEADENEVLRHWEGLGYYRRARQMHVAARQLIAAGRNSFPCELNEVLRLPGVGRYTAGAILSIAFDAPLPILEANTIRLFSRLTAFAGTVESTQGQKHLWSFAEAILPRRRVGTFNQALMELGALICTPKTPSCDRCPVQALCPTYAKSLQASIPRPKPSRQYKELFEAALVVMDDDRVALRRCGADERWAGLWDFPRLRLDLSLRDESESAVARALARLGVEHLSQPLGGPLEIGARLATIRHGVTRFRITLACYHARVLRPDRKLDSPFAWTPLAEVDRFPLSSTGRKIANLAKRHREALREQEAKKTTKQ